MNQLITIKGVGPWTAQMFLIFTLNRPDIFPLGDLGVQKGFQKYFKLEKVPALDIMKKRAEQWKPFRTVVSLYLWRVIDGPFEIFDETITPIPVMHGNNNINGYRVGNLGYITDTSEISENSMKLLEGIDVLLLDCLRMEPHFTHLSFPESIEIAKKINSKETYLIHMTHNLEYESLEKMLPEGIYVGYDGLKLQIN